MKKLNNLKWFSLGVFACLIVSIASTPAFASSLKKSAQLVYNNIKISLNGTTITPTDASGNVVEPFTINGTTYLPVRAISNALGLNVNWNSSTNTVEITDDSNNTNAPKSSTIVNYPNTSTPTYTSITGRQIDQIIEGSYIYDYDETECINYQTYLIQHGFRLIKTTTGEGMISNFYSNGKSLVAVGYVAKYNSVIIIANQ